MRIIDVYVKVFEDEDSDIPTSDVLCNVITMTQESFSIGHEGNTESRSRTVLYVFNPENGVVQDVLLKDVTINTWENEIKELNIISNPFRVGQEGNDPS